MHDAQEQCLLLKCSSSVLHGIITAYESADLINKYKELNTTLHLSMQSLSRETSTIEYEKVTSNPAKTTSIRFIT